MPRNLGVFQITNVAAMESGIIYSTFIDPILKPMRLHVAEEIKSGEKVIDIACGTGAQAFELAKKAQKVVGIDYSESMILQALKTIAKYQIKNVEMKICNATHLEGFSNNDFDVSVITLALHQFSPELYAPILNEMKRVAKKIIIVDYSVPLPKNYAGIGSQIAEFIAGREHNRNFNQFYKLGGLNSILPQNNLHIKKSVLFGKGAFQLVVCASF